jgi:molybdopterin-guanine dinucleotide biosynthesis protein A
MSLPFDAVVLAGGESRRLGGRDKVLETVGGVRLLDRVVAAVDAAQTVVVVGEPRPGIAGVTWTREQPPGGGPVAGLAAGLALVTAEHVVLLAADLPFVTAGHVERLLEVVGTAGAVGAMYVDAHGRDQPLASAWRVASLRAVLPPEPSGHGLRRVLAPLPVTRLDGGQDLVDCDTEPELSEARLRADRGDFL